jgi:hypothetical protein
LILTSYNTPLVTVLTAQFVHETGMERNQLRGRTRMQHLTFGQSRLRHPFLDSESASLPAFDGRL